MKAQNSFGAHLGPLELAVPHLMKVIMRAAIQSASRRAVADGGWIDAIATTASASARPSAAGMCRAAYPERGDGCW